MVPVHRGQSVTRWGVAEREAAGEHRPSGSPIAEMTRAYTRVIWGRSRVIWGRSRVIWGRSRVSGVDLG